MKKVMLTTGGTGGHIYPALAVADKLKLKGVDTVFVGSTERMEKDLVPDSGHKFIGIDISVPRGWKNIRKYLKAIKVAFKVIKEETPRSAESASAILSVAPSSSERAPWARWVASISASACSKRGSCS